VASKKFGYARVSSKDQNLARQIEILKGEGIEERDIFVEKESGRSLSGACIVLWWIISSGRETCWWSPS